MVTYLQSLQNALHQLFSQDPSVLLIGEDLADPYGGAFKVSKGLSSAFPGRVISTPISEAGFTGLATGMALRGLKPIVEIMFGDFLTLCADQIINHMVKFPGMYNDQVSVPIVIRTPMGGGRGYGATHSQSLEKIYLGTPQLQVIAPSHAHDPGELLHQAVKQPGPVLFIEHKLLYPLSLFGGDEVLQISQSSEIMGFPTSTVTNYKAGDPDVTVIAYGGVSRELMPLLADLHREEIKVMAVFPSSIQPFPIETLVEAASRSRRVVIAEEGTAGFNWGSEVASCLYDRLFGTLEAPIHRVASANAIIPAAREREAEVLINASKIEQAIWKAVS